MDDILNENTEKETHTSDLPPELNTSGNSRMDTEARWYVLHTFNGYEAVAEDNLKTVVKKYNLQDRILEIFIPKEDTVVEKKDGKKVIVENKTMPTYIFVKMVYGDDIWHTITRTRGITGFVGPKGRPLPLNSADVIKMKLERKVNINVKLEKDDTIQIIDGPLLGQTARVTDVDSAGSKVTVIVTMFGRNNKVDLHTTQVKKI
jgi:transcriptional antiterminator NusG